MKIKKIKESFIKASKSLVNSAPILVGVMLLISLVTTLIPKTVIATLFQGNYIVDTLIGSALGSILAGNPVTSYVLGGELLSAGVSLLAITAFLVSWVTVGFVQLPAESMLLGKRFAITRNVTAFIFSIIVASITVLVVSFI